MKFVPKNILVSGGAGFIGANFIHYLLEKHSSINVVNLDLLTYAGNLESLAAIAHDARYTFIRGDVCDQKLIKSLLSDYVIDTIVHFAAESHVDRSIHAPASFIKTNILGTCNLLDSALKFWQKKFSLNPAQCRFHHISTDEVYGSLNQDDLPFTENNKYLPSSPYSASKAGSDHLVGAYYTTYGLPMTISNCSNNYGPFQHLEKFIPTIIKACLNQQPIPIYGDGSNIRDWLFVGDHCEAINLVLTKGEVGETYNIGGNAELSNLELTKIICEVFDKKNPGAGPHARLISYVEDRLGHDWRYSINTSKIYHQLGWQPKRKLNEGLQLTIDWFESTLNTKDLIKVS